MPHAVEVRGYKTLPLLQGLQVPNKAIYIPGGLVPALVHFLKYPLECLNPGGLISMDSPEKYKGWSIFTAQELPDYTFLLYGSRQCF